MRTKEHHPFPDMIHGPGSHVGLRTDLPVATFPLSSPEMTNFDTVLQKTIHQPAVIEPDFAQIQKPVFIPFQPNA
jgi:hypothetical protein